MVARFGSELRRPAASDSGLLCDAHSDLEQPHVRAPLHRRRQPAQAETWCGYLRRVRTFWTRNDPLRADRSLLVRGRRARTRGQRLVARQAATLHRCFPEGKQLMTGNPTRANAFLRDGKFGNDLDIWTVLSRRYYGRLARAGRNRARGSLKVLNKVRARGKMVWSYTYTGTRGTPGFAATEPELHLLAGLARMARVDRAPCENVPVPPARAIGQHRLAVARDLQPDAGRIPVDQLRRRGRRRKDGGGYDGGKKESGHGISRAPTLATAQHGGGSSGCRSGVELVVQRRGGEEVDPVWGVAGRSAKLS